MQKIESYTRLIENTLARQDFDSEPNELYAPISYILSLGGKRLRPAMAIATCDLYGGDISNAVMPALGIEIFHNFSLIHDDILDKAPLRRGKKTVHEKWDQDIALLSGDAMLVKSYQYIASVEAAILPQVMKTFSTTAIEVCEGQQYDLNFEKLATVAEEDYIEMIRLKTSVLLGCALKIGALVAGAPAKEADKLYHFGVNIGIAFQIQDDILDAFGNPEKFGKTPGGDIINDKKTILMIHAQKNATPQQLQQLKADYPKDDEKVKAIRTLFTAIGSKNHAMAKMEAYYHEALKHLDESAGKADIKSELANFAQWLIKRDI
jgi:geranylgeranyl diphosphate synthase type II